MRFPTHSPAALAAAALAFLPVSPLLADATDSVVVFNEIMYHPAAASEPAEVAAEWIELRNQMAVDIDLTGWSLTGGVNYSFPPGTIIPGGAHMVIAANPAAAGVPSALGPWTGKLDNGGETLTLRNNNDRIMDEVAYGTDGDWPCAPDGGGASLAKRAVNLASPPAASWRSSARTGGTPGLENFDTFLPPVTTTVLDANGTWKYRADGVDPGTAWRAEAADESGFTPAPAAFRLGSDALPAPAEFNTALPSGPTAYYYRRSFTFSGQAPYTTLRCRVLADDGTAFYLNGAEVLRDNLPAAAVHSTPALTPRRAAPVWREFDLPATALHAGTNVLAAEVHQAATLPSYAAAVIASGPVGYWRLGESSTATGAVSDLAELPAAPESGAQSGTLQGLLPTNVATPGPRPTDTIGGQPLLGFEATNAAPSFQGVNDGGNDAVTIPDPGALNFSTGRKFTLEAWVKAPATGQESGGAVIAKGTGGGGEQFAIDIVNGTYRFFHWDPVTAAVANSSVAPNNTWQHVVAVLDSAAGIMRIHVNGVQTGTSTPRATMVNNTHEISIGARKNSGSSAYDLNLQGVVDEVAVYDRALTAAEITAHYNAAFAAGSTVLDTTDAAFAAELITVETLPATSAMPLALNELSPTAAEICNTGGVPLEVTGCSLKQIMPAGSVVIPLSGTVPPAGFLNTSLTAAPGDRIVLFAPDGLTILDSFDVKNTPRGRFPDGTGAWLRPTAATPGSANAVTLQDSIVINEIMYDHPSSTLFPPGTPLPGQWIELHNKSAAAVSLAGWKLNRAVDFTFPAGAVLAAGDYLIVAENPAAAIAAHSLPTAKVFGPWSGNLSHSSDRIVLEDAAGNPADDVTFYSEGRWADAANAGGSSLELRDPRADNNTAESWAASDESGDIGWQTFTWSGPSAPSQSGEPNLWRELALCFVDGPGECLVDDVRVTDTTSGNDLIQNGNFSSGATKWRLLGNHRTSRVEPEPGNPGNSVLRVIASGPGEYQGNQIETTFLSNTALVENRVYEVSLRAKWISGGGRLNTRLYFNRLPRTNILNIASAGGTPAAPNLRFAGNIGPSLVNLAHTPVIPAANQPVTVTVDAADPDGTGSVNLKYSANGGAWQTAAMASADGRRFSGQIPGQASGVIQFYVEGRDGLNVTSLFPARGADSRALIQVQDGQASGTLQKLRLVMTAADAAYMHTNNNVLSNEFLGCTLVMNESEVFYDTGVRLKGSFVGRNVPRVGFSLRFNSDQLFRGVHDKAAIDRSQHSTVAQGEIIAKHIAARAGGIPAMHDDLARFIHPQSGYTSACQIRTTAFDDIYLDSQFPNGSDGTQFEIEVIRWHTTTVDGNPESPKQVSVSANGYANLELQTWGTAAQQAANDREPYRWTALQTSHRDRDDFTRMIALEKMFGSPAGAAFNAEAAQRLDYEAFLRTLAYMSLVGPADAVYTGSNLHNYRLHFRAHDGRAMMMPWDWDSAWQRSTSGSLVGGSNLAKTVNASQDTLRRYYCHLYEIIQSTYNQAYMSRWTTHYGNLVGENYSSILSYINNRANFVLSQLPTATAFAANAGAVNANGSVTLTGTANIQVAFIEVNGLAYTPVWTSTTAWSLLVPLGAGANTLNIRGLTKAGAPVSGATGSLNVNNPNPPGWAPLRINEWMAENDGAFPDPADGAGDDWFEIHNPTAQPVDVSGWKLSDNEAAPGVFTIPNGWSIPAGGFLLVWADNEPAQNPATFTAGSHLHVSFRLNNAGETILLSAPDLREVDRVTFGPQTADDAEGRYPDGAAARAFLTVPTPGTANVLTEFSLISLLGAAPEIEITATPGWSYQLESSTDQQAWLPWADPVTAAGTSVTIPAAATGPRRFFRVLTEP
jgi:hypothetical protein